MSSGPDNGDLSAGLTGWTTIGRAPADLVPTIGGTAARLRDNATLLSPSFEVPSDGHTVDLTLRAPAGGVVAQVLAQAASGRSRYLATLEPTRALRTYRVSLAGLAGESVRVVVDPVTALGRGLDVGGVGRVRTLLPGWEVRRGAATATRSRGRRALRVPEGRLVARSPSFAPGAAAVALIVSVRGRGTLVATAGAGGARLRASDSWRDLRVRLRPGRRNATLVLRAVAGSGPIEVADLGLVVRRTVIQRPAVAKRGRTVVVRGRLVPAGGGLRVVLAAPDGRRLASTRAGRDGRFTLRTAARVARGTLVVAGDRTRLPARRPIRLAAGG